ncbi:DUF5916 domain-containing protein [Parabacteroides sp. FAFU027]|uniref:DUF5916 domain-containing protein n=1 Tax=Parabacteroides sp. FAFU027 TaxID=2922715 RepID=UPI001FAF6F1B|nr:DUF5916 domain-containing protein [Parabacteroides sp. FAFU027]
MRYLSLLLIPIVCFGHVFAVQKKSVEVLPISKPLTIDAVLDEPVYSQAKPAKDFVQLQPLNGKPSFQPSEVFLFYDQTAIYVGAHLYDSAPDSIFNFLTTRDDTGMSDYFGIYIDPYNQGQLAFGFFVTTAGVQIDLKAVKSDGDNEDASWNAVWESKTRLTSDGWIAEMRIPFSALRFSGKTGNTWGMNMFRNIRRYNSNNSWSMVDRNVSGFIHQEGEMTGLKDIKPPVRLSFSPYLATYAETKAGEKADFLYKAGMDMKYGINESFTLDMMLIPDFGQIQSDDKKLNLTPYELYYSEKRQFFTEGTELFQRGNIFYSRRIGAYPKFGGKADDALRDNEEIYYRPTETQLANATKISGRTADGWGIGFLNAVSVDSYAKLRDTITGNHRRVNIQPLTNYNVAVVDKSLPHNSYFSLINTNMMMANNSFMANVTATDFQFRDKSLKYALKAKGAISTRGDSSRETGYYGQFSLEKNRGKLQFGLNEWLYSDKYNPNDLGYLQRNNIILSEGWIYYQKVEPFSIFREVNGNLWWDYYRVFNPSTVFNHEMGYNLNMLFKNNYSFYANGGIGTDKKDYFEPRVKGRFFFTPHYYWHNLNLNTDTRKSLSFYFHIGMNAQPHTDAYSILGDGSATLRIGQHTQLNYGVSFNNAYNNIGFTDKTDNDSTIVFAKRNVKVLENILSASYMLNNRSGLTLRVRHYWSGNANKNFYYLQRDGNLLSANDYQENEDQNYNAFTVDMIFRWIFAPGSELSLGWKSAALENQDKVITNYWNNLTRYWKSPANSLSVRVLYYLDYNNLRKKKD